MKYLIPLIVLFLAATSFTQTTQPATQPITVNVPTSLVPSQVVVNVPATEIQATPAPIPAPPPKMAIGTNVQANDYVQGGAMWNDVSHQMSGWFGVPDGQHGITTWDDNGYPSICAQGNVARSFTYLFGYPSGNYTVTWTGAAGAITFTGGKQVTGVMPNGPNCWRATVAFNSGDRCEIQQPGGVTNIHIYAPDAVPGRTFRDAYLNRLRPYKVVRLMPTEHVNGNGLPPTLHTTWAQRVTPAQWDQTTWEMALEYQAELARESGCTPWVSLPYGIDDATVVNIAQVFVTFPTVIVEYGNENWNQAAAYPGTQIRHDALALGIYQTTDPNVAGARHAATLTARAGKLFKQTIGADHVKVVFGAQAVWNAWASDGLGWLHPGDVDAVAIAPYFQPADSLLNPTVPQILASCAKWVDTTLAQGIAANAQVAAKFGVPLWAYEGGQQMFPIYKAPAIELAWGGDLTLPEWGAYQTDPYRMAVLDPNMGPLYDHLFYVCSNDGITLFCHFMMNGNWGRSGFWGLTQTITDGSNSRTLATDRAIAAGNN